MFTSKCLRTMTIKFGMNQIGIKVILLYVNLILVLGIGIRRVKTPIEPIEELKEIKSEKLRVSGSYSIESLRNNQNATLMLSKMDPNWNRTYNTHYYSKPKDPVYVTKLNRFVKKDGITDPTIKSLKDGNKLLIRKLYNQIF